jgi:hypothetical protein
VALEISVVIPARDEAAAIGACLAALARQTVGASALEVIVVAAGKDDTAGAAERAGGSLGFGRLEVVPIERGNKNVALQVGCAHVTAPVVVLLDADTELAPDAVAELARAVRDGPERAVHGAAVPRFDTWISRYWELNRMLVKDLHFDGALSGEFVALRRATLAGHDPAALFPEATSAKGDLYLARALAARGCRIGYVPSARGTTHTPWTLAGLARTMLRSRRGLMAIATRRDACTQALRAAMLAGGVPAALAVLRWSPALAAVCLVPPLAHAGVVAWRVAALRRRGLGDHRRELPRFLALDLLGRAIKLWAYVERVGGRRAPYSFRGERPGELGAAAPVRRAA